MSWMAVAVGGSAILGYLGSRQQAKAANKKKTEHTDQTTTQNPFAIDRINPDIDQILDMQRGIAQRGAPRVDSAGNVVYDPLPSINNLNPTSGASPTPTPMPKPTGRAGAGNRGRAGAGNRGRAGRNANATAAATGPNLTTPQGVLTEVARRGLDAGNTPTIGQARNVMSNIWGDAAGSGSADGGEQTGYEGYNPILDRLTGTLEGDVNDRVGRDLLLGFLDETGRGGGSAGSGGGTSVPGASPGSVPTWFADQQNWFGPKNQATGPGANGSGGVPDTMAPESFFGTETRKVFDEQANDAELQSLIDAMNKDTERSMYQDLAQLNAAAQGAGRLGGDTWKGMSADARRAALDAMNKSSATVRVGDRESRRQAKLTALAGVNQRDLGLLGANVQREGIAAGERASGAASAASAASAADQLALAKRAQDLSAIGALMDNERFSVGQLGDVGSQLSGDRLASLGMVPGLEGIGLQGLQTAMGAGGELVNMRGQDVNRQIAGAQAAIQRQGMAQQLGMFNAGQQQAAVNDYLRTVLGIGGMGGTSHTVGTNVQPGLGVSPTGAGIQGAVGGAATGMGLYNMYRGG